MSDPRFARLKSDPRFRRLKKHKSKVVVDDRFKSVFEGGKDKGKGRAERAVDKYGRRLSANHDKDKLRRFYRLENDEEPAPVPDYARGAVLMESSDEEDEQDDQESDIEGPVVFGQDALDPQYTTRDEVAEIDLDEDNFADLDAQAAAYSKEHADEDIDGEQTRRLAVVNLDWDHVKATHLYKVFSSLVSSTAPLLVESSKKKTVDDDIKRSNVSKGRVLHVKVYPSQFGKERMAQEEKGPPAELFKKRRELDPDEVNEKNIYELEDTEEYDEDALRKYQIDRLRYYYAIVTCDTTEAAAHIYSELQGTELERSANLIDLSYVPDDMTFDDEPRDIADETLVANYKGIDFVTDALRHSKVKLTWDDDDPERNQITRRALTKKEIEEDDFRAYIASASESEDDADQQSKKAASREKLRALLLGGDQDLPEGWGDGGDDPDDVDMQVTFTSGLNQTVPDDETTLEKYQRKMREKRKKRKDELKKKTETDAPAEKKVDAADDFFAYGSDSEGEAPSTDREEQKPNRSRPDGKSVATEEELALLISENPGTEPQHFNLKSVIKAEKKMKGKRKKGKKAAEIVDEAQEDFVIDVADDRFKAIHEDHSFAIDPSNPKFKKTKSMAALLDERAKRHKSGGRLEEAGASSVQAQVSEPSRSLSSLVESVKRKSSSIGSQQSGKRKKKARTE